VSSDALVFHGGPILAMEPGTSPEVVVVRAGRIVACGPRESACAWPRARRIDLAGRTLLPGFIDAHSHLSIAALQPLWADLRTVADPDELRAALTEQARREPGAGWIRGYGFDELVSGFTIDRHLLDSFSLDRPVLAAHYSLHQCVVGSAGLDALGIGRETRDPEGGRIERTDRGDPTGVLVERAWSDAHARSAAAYFDPDRWADLFVDRARTLLRDGITAIHDAACSPTAERIYHRLAREHRLPIGIVAMPHAEGILGDLPSERLDGPRTGEGDEWLRTGAIKLFADGGIEPAIDVHIGGHRMEVGTLIPGLIDAAARAVERGFAVAIHAIGNAGLREALAAFRAADRTRGGRDLRFRVEHATLASCEQASQMAALGTIGVVQPGFIHHVGARTQGVEFDDAVWLPFANLARAGVLLAASSDDPCAFYEPLLTSARGTSRRCATGAVVSPEQSLPYEDWLRAYTLGAATAGGQEDHRGSLRPGKRADLVVLDGALDPDDPPVVAQTWVAGELVWERET